MCGNGKGNGGMQGFDHMDEVGSDPTKHRRKIIGDKRNISRAFTITPEGDRMNGHVTVCVTTRADGTLTLML